MRAIHDCVEKVLARFAGYTIANVVEGEDHHFRVLINKTTPGKTGREHKLDAAMVEALEECGLVGYTIKHSEDKILFDLDLLSDDHRRC